MGKRSVGVGVWLVIGALVLVAMAPKEFSIGLGVTGVSALIAYLAIKHPSQKEGRDAHQHEPTLAELIAKSEPQRSARRPAAPSAGRPRTAPEHPLVESLGQSSEWRATRQATINVNPEHAQTLRDKFPPTSPRTNEQISAPAHPAPPPSPPPRAPRNSAPPVDTPSGSQPTDLPDQSAEWNATRQATIEAIRERVQALRDKFPVIPPRTNEQISEPARSASPAPPPPRAPQNSIPSADTPSGSQPTDLPDQSAEWNATRQATIEAMRERVQALRDKFPVIPPRTNEQISEPARSASPAPPPPRAPQNSIPSADTPSGSQSTKLPDEAAEWRAIHRATIDTNRARAQALRVKFPPTLPRTNEQISAQVELAASPVTLQPPTPSRVSERAIASSSQLDPTSPSSATDIPALNPERSRGDFMRLLQGSHEPEPFYSATGISKPPLAHSLPAAPTGFDEGRWVPPGESIEVAGVNLPGGMLYVGGGLKALNGSAEPCLISGQLTVARVGSYRARQMGYWPSYADASPGERRAYLNWLSEGRWCPDCDIGYVFLFFYGLERRVIMDSRSDPAARNDWPAIVAELRRLLAIYGERSVSFNRSAGELLSWIELDGRSGQLYKQPVPDFPRTYALPPYLRLALGHAAVDRAPLPAHLALAWIRLSPECYLRTAATRCPSEFERLFIQRYHEILGPGLVLPQNRTKLKLIYQAASAGLHNVTITMALGDVPDVTVLTAPVRKLMEIASQCTDELGSYSRLVGKDPAAAGALEGLLLLPFTIWPAATQAKLQELTARIHEGQLSLPLKELLSVLGGANQVINRDRARGLARALESAEIGMEPHVLGGAKAPGEQDTVVLFAQPPMESGVGSRAEYQTAALTLQLASAVAQTDGVFHDREIAHLRAEIEGWTHLTPAERRRLHAHLQLLTTSPMNLATLKKKLEPLPTKAREMLAAFMATLAQADGVVSPDEVKFLEKVYKALGVEPKRVFSDIHAGGSGGAPMSTVQAEKQGFRLDARRIAALQEDTARVSALLSKIFTEEADSTTAPPATPELELVDKADAPLGLDEDHSALLRLLLSRPEWTRAELEDAAADLDLMLDGAMEQINEAAFEAFDEPLFEGEDPISVNTKLLEKIEA